MACAEMESILDKFNSFTEKPAKFLTVQSDIKDDVKNLVKNIYDYTKAQENNRIRSKKGALPDLIVEDFDEEQIWQQIELQNTECWDKLVWEVANCISIKNDLEFPVKTTEDSDEIFEENSDNESLSDDELPAEEEDISLELTKSQIKTTKHINNTKIGRKSKPSIVDDDFFRLQEMEQFLISEEKKEGKPKKADADSDEESIDMFQEDDGDVGDDDEQNGDVMYADFFAENEDQENEDQANDTNNDYPENMNENGDMTCDEEVDSDQERIRKKEKKVRFAQPSSSEGDSDDGKDNDNLNKSDEKKSDFELRQQRLKQQIERLEEKTLKEAPWQLKGEVDSSKRPQNSLLQEVVDFDLTTRPAPIITEQTTLTLEDIIMRRIKDKAWDDVVKKEKPVDDQLAFRKKEVLDHSKSKLSLAQVYETEYLKRKQALSGELEEEKEPESHKEIRTNMAQLFEKLDALCHYHYTPKAVQAEVKIVTNTPAISMEEVAPVATSDAALLAPEEVKKNRRGDLMSKEERTKTDKNRERRKKKNFQREKGKVEKVTDHRNTKKGTEVNNDKSLKTSKAFFQQLNDNSNSLIKTSKNKRKNKGQ